MRHTTAQPTTPMLNLWRTSIIQPTLAAGHRLWGSPRHQVTNSGAPDPPGSCLHAEACPLQTTLSWRAVLRSGTIHCRTYRFSLCAIALIDTCNLYRRCCCRHRSFCCTVGVEGLAGGKKKKKSKGKGDGGGGGSGQGGLQHMMNARLVTLAEHHK